ncbi:MAG TPA: ABC transporter permease [Candidatus Dormibacteraeota bacterium]|nr:ABC transporter permease [Candidatus Dormibacteraeota bacterium]
MSTLTPNRTGPGMESEARSFLATFNDTVKSYLLPVQNYIELTWQAITNIFTPPFYFGDLIDQMDVIGVGSLPIIVLTGFFIGAILVLQTAAQFARFGTTSLTGDAVSLALIRELGPTITALLVAGRSASGIASELGSMVVTEQVDAMRAMGTDPGRKLVTPRLVATLVVLPLLTAVADFVGLVGGFLVAHATLGLTTGEFWHHAINALGPHDLIQGMTKPIVFAFVIATVGCFKGLTVRGGTEGVGRATTSAVVVSSVAILVTGFFLDKLLLFVFP